MARLRPGDRRLHYSDSSHRWIAPPDVDQAVWEASVRAHMEQHRATMDAPVVWTGRRQPLAEPHARTAA